MHALPTDYAEHKNLLQKSLSVQQSFAYAGQKGRKAINPEASLTLPLDSKVLFIVKIPGCRPSIYLPGGGFSKLTSREASSCFEIPQLAHSSVGYSVGVANVQRTCLYQ